MQQRSASARRLQSLRVHISLKQSNATALATAPPPSQQRDGDLASLTVAELEAQRSISEEAVRAASSRIASLQATIAEANDGAADDGPAFRAKLQAVKVDRIEVL
jgi:hypothetical protein